MLLTGVWGRVKRSTACISQTLVGQALLVEEVVETLQWADRKPNKDRVTGSAPAIDVSYRNPEVSWKAKTDVERLNKCCRKAK